MAPKLLFIVSATALLFTTTPARAAWIVQPVDGYGCPPGYDLQVIRSDEAVIDVCVPEREALAPPDDEMKGTGEEHTAQGPLGEDTSDTERM